MRSRAPRISGRHMEYAMIRTGQQYLDSIRDNHEVYINGERVKDVTFR
jgi:hypothetical protein